MNKWTGWLVMSVLQHVDLTTSFGDRRLPLCIAPGMTGACPIFKTEEEAKKWAGPNVQVLEVRLKGKQT